MIKRQQLAVGFAVALFIGTAIYFRLWTIDNNNNILDKDDLQNLRAQFERANMEAMDESAEWRLKYDTEVLRSRQFQDDLLKVQKSSTLLQKENVELRKEISALRQRIEACKCS